MIEYTVKVYGKNEHNLAGTYWYLNGKYHRVEVDPMGLTLPAIECANGDKFWYLNGKYHRVDGPAIEYADGDKFWYLNGKAHRVDGPAIEYADGNKHWYLNDIKYSEADFKLEVAKLNKQSDPCDGKEVLIDGKKYKLTAV